MDKSSKSSSKTSSAAGPAAKKGPSNASAPSEQELKEEEELQLALALSLSETPTKFSFPDCKQFEENNSNSSNSYSDSKHSSNKSVSTDGRNKSQSPRNQYNQTDNHHKQQSLTTAAPENLMPNVSDQQALRNSQSQSQPQADNYLVNNSDNELFRFIAEIQSTAEVFANRVKSNKMRSRPVESDSAIQSLFLKLTDMHTKLLEYTKRHDAERAVYEGIQDKLTQIADARAALDALREEHQEKVRREAAEAERLRQSQLASKLEMMRQKKTEMMQYQRSMALQRIQAQEGTMNQPQNYTPNLPGTSYQPEHTAGVSQPFQQQSSTSLDHLQQLNSHPQPQMHPQQQHQTYSTTIPHQLPPVQQHASLAQPMSQPHTQTNQTSLQTMVTQPVQHAPQYQLPGSQLTHSQQQYPASIGTTAPTSAPAPPPAPKVEDEAPLISFDD